MLPALILKMPCEPSAPPTVTGPLKISVRTLGVGAWKVPTPLTLVAPVTVSVLVPQLNVPPTCVSVLLNNTVPEPSVMVPGPTETVLVTVMLVAPELNVPPVTASVLCSAAADEPAFVLRMRPVPPLTVTAPINVGAPSVVAPPVICVVVVTATVALPALTVPPLTARDGNVTVCAPKVVVPLLTVTAPENASDVAVVRSMLVVPPLIWVRPMMLRLAFPGLNVPPLTVRPGSVTVSGEPGDGNVVVPPLTVKRLEND